MKSFGFFIITALILLLSCSCEEIQENTISLYGNNGQPIQTWEHIKRYQKINERIYFRDQKGNEVSISGTVIIQNHPK